MEIQQIRYFLALCEKGSFSRAAEVCDVSQPALTTAIKRVEDEMGGTLFHREGKRVTLSRLGQMLRPHFEQMLGDREAALQIARNFRLLHHAPVSVGVMPTIGAARFAPVFDHFRREHPSVELAVSSAALVDLLAQLDAGGLDLAIVSAPNGLPDIYRSEPLCRERYMVIVPPGHRFARVSSVALQDVSGEAYVDRLSCEMRESVMAVCAEREIELYAHVRSEREDWIESMVAAGLGFAFLPESSVVHRGVVARPLTDPAVERQLLLADVRGRQRSPAGQALARTLVQRLAEAA
jgi:DNA-binding transcriptional LysR family regulator